MHEICAKHIFGGNSYVRSKFSCVRSSHDLCAHAHANSLEGKLPIIIINNNNVDLYMVP